MTKLLHHLLLALLASYCLSPRLALAIEPPNPSVKDAVTSGHAAFVGRIIRLEETAKGNLQTEVEAVIQPLTCYYGLDCNSIRFIKLRYVSETTAATMLPVEFSISSEVLIILNRPVSSEILNFDSDFKGGIDIAYVIRDAFPRDYYDCSKLRLLNIYLQNVTHVVDAVEITKWAQERALQLERNQEGAR